MDPQKTDETKENNNNMIEEVDAAEQIEMAVPPPPLPQQEPIVTRVFSSESNLDDDDEEDEQVDMESIMGAVISEKVKANSSSTAGGTQNKNNASASSMESVPGAFSIQAGANSIERRALDSLTAFEEDALKSADTGSTSSHDEDEESGSILVPRAALVVSP